MAQGYETQSYDVIQTFSEGEIRFYHSVMKVKTNNKGGFSSLFKYISGNNSKQQKIAMTTPVHRDKNGGSETMEFVLPKQFDLENTPLPTSNNVEVYQSKAGYFAAFKFSGYTNTKKEQMIIEKGKKILAENNISFTGSPVVLIYNSPYTIFNRKNEILFAIKFSK
jgi:hypothetical protein